MPLRIDREHVAKSSHTAPVYNGGLGRIVSGMKVTNIEGDSVGISSFMQDLSSLYSQDRVEQFGAENSVR
jgi:hypothetical protein